MPPKGQVIVVSGAGGSLGQHVLAAFAAAGAEVVALDRQFRAKPAAAAAIETDVTDAGRIEGTIAEVHRRFGRIDCLCNLVGGFALGSLAETEPALWDRMLGLNLTSAFLLSRAVLPRMLEQRSGCLLHVAAQAVLQPFPGAAAYLVAKSALASMVRILALELAGTGVRVNAVLPTTMDTPANRASMPEADPAAWLKPEAVARLLVLLAGEESRAVSGALIPLQAG